MGTPARCTSSLQGSTHSPSRAHQGQHRKQWSGDAVAAVEALIHAVDTLLRRAWKPMRRGLQSISRWRTRGGARDGLIPRRRSADGRTWAR